MTHTSNQNDVEQALTLQDLDNLDWQKTAGLIPAIVQDSADGRVLMQAFMNRAALEKTFSEGLVTFWSRSRQELWTKGDTSGNRLKLISITADCDHDCLLIQASPTGPVCHRGTETCFGDSTKPAVNLIFLTELDQLIARRNAERPEGSYTTRLFEAGVKRIAQKVAEEGAETALAAAAGDADETVNEAADLIYHLLVLLQSKGLGLADVIEQLEIRHS